MPYSAYHLAHCYCDPGSLNRPGNRSSPLWTQTAAGNMSTSSFVMLLHCQPFGSAHLCTSLHIYVVKAEPCFCYAADLQVLHTQGSPQLWKATYKAGKLINAANAASQDLNPRNRTVINRAEYFGKQLYVSASGSYLPLVRLARNSCIGGTDHLPCALLKS